MLQSRSLAFPGIIHELPYGELQVAGPRHCTDCHDNFQVIQQLSDEPVDVWNISDELVHVWNISYSRQS